MSAERAGEFRGGPLSVRVPRGVSRVLRHECENIRGVVIESADS